MHPSCDLKYYPRVSESPIYISSSDFFRCTSDRDPTGSPPSSLGRLTYPADLSGPECNADPTPHPPSSVCLNKWHHNPPSYSGQKPLLPSLWSILFQNKPLLTHSTATTPIQDTIIFPLHNSKSLLVQTRARRILCKSINKTISCL